VAYALPPRHAPECRPARRTPNLVASPARRKESGTGLARPPHTRAAVKAADRRALINTLSRTASGALAVPAVDSTETGSQREVSTRFGSIPQPFVGLADVQIQ
jgi:hypothetical protein